MEDHGALSADRSRRRFRTAYWRAIRELDTVRLLQWERSHLTLPQLRILFQVQRRPGVTTAQLSRTMGITVSTTSGLVAQARRCRAGGPRARARRQAPDTARIDRSRPRAGGRPRRVRPAVPRPAGRWLWATSCSRSSPPSIAWRRRRAAAREEDGETYAAAAEADESRLREALARRSHGFRALRNRNYRLFWFGQMSSVAGTWMQDTALAALVLKLTNSPFALRPDHDHPLPAGAVHLAVRRGAGRPVAQAVHPHGHADAPDADRPASLAAFTQAEHDHGGCRLCAGGPAGRGRRRRHAHPAGLHRGDGGSRRPTERCGAQLGPVQRGPHRGARPWPPLLVLPAPWARPSASTRTRSASWPSSSPTCS